MANPKRRFDRRNHFMSEDNQQQNNQEKKPRETLEQFANRVGLKYVRGRGGIQFGAYSN